MSAPILCSAKIQKKFGVPGVPGVLRSSYIHLFRTSGTSDFSSLQTIFLYLHISILNIAIMAKMLKVGIFTETRNPADRRVPLTPPQIVALEELYPNVEFFVQPSDFRCYSNEEYEYLDIPLKEDLRECDILLGVKEVDRRTFIPGKNISLLCTCCQETTP